jgi:hypothetical protein
VSGVESSFGTYLSLENAEPVNADEGNRLEYPQGSEGKTRTDDTSLFSVQPVICIYYLPFILKRLQSWDLPKVPSEIVRT